MAKNKKRILYLCSDRGISIGGTKGASIHIREFVDTLAKEGYELIVAVSKKEGERTFEADYPVHFLPEPSDFVFAANPEMGADERQSLNEAADYFRNKAVHDFVLELYSKTKFDLIYERYSLFGMAGRVASKTVGVPLVMEVNAPLVFEAGQYRKLHHVALAKSIESFLFSNADHIVSVSSDLREYIIRTAADAKVSVVPNGVSLEQFDRANNDNNWRKRLTKHPETDFVVGFVGSIKPWHGVDFIIDTLAELLATDEHFSLCIVGNGDKKYQSQLEEQRKKKKLKEKVTFLGAVPYESIPSIMKSLDVLVAPYPDLTNFYFSPLKIFEYMASGRPIVSSSIGQIKDVLSHEQTALLVPPGDQRAWKEALVRIKSDYSLRQRLALASYTEVSRKHLWRHRIEKISEIIENVSCTPSVYKAD